MKNNDYFEVCHKDTCARGTGEYAERLFQLFAGLLAIGVLVFIAFKLIR